MGTVRETKTGNRKKRKIRAFEFEDLNFAKPAVSAEINWTYTCNLPC